MCSDTCVWSKWWAGFKAIAVIQLEWIQQQPNLRLTWLHNLVKTIQSENWNVIKVPFHFINKRCIFIACIHTIHSLVHGKFPVFTLHRFLSVSCFWRWELESHNWKSTTLPCVQSVHEFPTDSTNNLLLLIWWELFALTAVFDQKKKRFTRYRQSFFFFLIEVNPSERQSILQNTKVMERKKTIKMPSSTLDIMLLMLW